MDAIRQVIFTLVALLAGLVIGAVLMNLNLRPRLADLSSANESLQAKVRQAETQIELLKADTDRFARQNEALRGEIDALQHAETEPQLLGAAAPAPTEATQPPVVENGDELGELMSALGEAAAKSTPRSLAKETGANPNGLGDDWSKLTGEERQARRSEFMAQVRQRTSDLVEAEAARATDPAVRQRLETLRQQSDYMLELMDQIREVKNDDERAQLQQQFDAAREDVGNLVQEQQDYMLRQVAAQYGITDPAKQAAFAQSLRETQASPLFRAPTLTWGISAAGRRGVE